MGEPIQPTAEPAAPAWDVATEQDVRACYRLLLEREPDAEGFASWSKLLAEQQLTLREVVEGFLQSPERLALAARRMEAERIELADFRIWVRRADPQVGFSIARDGQYEPHLTAKLRALLAPGAVFVDVGANIGWFTLLAAAQVGAEGRVHAFEARTDNVALLRRSLADNGFAHVDVHPCAVSDRPGSLAFFASGTWYSNGRIVGDDEPGSEQLPRVPAVTLDEALADAPRVDVIKMDIEGAEAKALAGMGALLRRHRPVLLTEFSPDLLRISSGVEPEAYLAALAAGHALYVLPADGGPEQGPFAPAEILAAQQAAGGTHLDLVAVPR
jgi:FkbM family methyltransferase